MSERAEIYRVKWKQDSRVQVEYFENRQEFRDALFSLSVGHLVTAAGLYRLQPWYVKFLWRWKDIAWGKDKRSETGITLLSAHRLVAGRWMEVIWKVTPPGLTWEVEGENVIWQHDDPLGRNATGPRR